jgi:hypothetical protein
VDLLQRVPSWELAQAIDAAVLDFAASLTGHAERLGDHRLGARLYVPGNRVATVLVDPTTGTLVVTSLGQVPDPDADPEEDAAWDAMSREHHSSEPPPDSDD